MFRSAVGLCRASHRVLTTSSSSARSSSARSSHALGMKIGTHDGTFHCDEALAVSLVRLLPEYAGARVVRSRDEQVLAGCELVVDVGAQFCHATRRYDHHQRDFAHTLSSLRPDLGDHYDIKLSSAGLVYAYYGERIIQSLVKELSEEDLRVIYKKVYQDLIQEIDAIDNGVPMTDAEPRYSIHTSLSSRVARLNPPWNSSGEVDSDALFERAMELVSEEFRYVVQHLASVWLPARQLVARAVQRRLEAHASGQVVALERALPWKEHLFQLEEQLAIAGHIKYVLFPDKSWRVQAVPVSPTSFVLRRALHPAWRGLRGEELDAALAAAAGGAGAGAGAGGAAGGAVFCHSSGFIGGHATRAGALLMAAASLAADPADPAD